MTQEKQQLSIEALARWPYDLLQKALQTDDLTSAVKANAAYSGLLTTLITQENVAQLMGSYLFLRPERKKEFIEQMRPLTVQLLAEFFFGGGVASGLTDALQNSEPNPRYYNRTGITMVSRVYFSPPEIASQGYTLGYNKSTREIFDIFSLIRDPKKIIPLHRRRK